MSMYIYTHMYVLACIPTYSHPHANLSLDSGAELKSELGELNSGLVELGGLEGLEN